MSSALQRAKFFAKEIENTDPENWPEVAEWPETDTSDLEKAAQHQSTIDAEFEQC